MFYSSIVGLFRSTASSSEFPHCEKLFSNAAADFVWAARYVTTNLNVSKLVATYHQSLPPPPPPPPPPWHTLWTCLNSTPTPPPPTHTHTRICCAQHVCATLHVQYSGGTPTWSDGLIDSGHACVATPTSIRTSSSSTPSTTDHDSVQQPGWDSSSNVKQAQGRSCMTWVAHTSLICMTFINVLY